MSETFMDRYVVGSAKDDDIYGEIENWHRGTHTVSLDAFLGMTTSEYALFMIDAGSLEAIRESRLSETDSIFPADLSFMDLQEFKARRDVLSQELVNRLAGGAAKCIESMSRFQEAICDLSKTPE